MKLIIREYLALLKESKELDLLLPGLLLMMGIEPISHPQVGVRQFGVDVAAVGKDEEQTDTLFLFTIKQGDLGRSDWSADEQSIRQSLEDISDVYLQNHVRPEHAALKKKVVLCTGGNLKQELDQNWASYTNKHTIEGELEFEFWGGDKLAILIEQHMFNEQILPVELRSSFRKVLALLGDPDYDLSDYFDLLERLLLQNDFGDLTKQSGLKKAKKALRTTHLLLNIIFAWAKDENNLKPAVLAAERTLLITWEFLRKNDLFARKSLFEIYVTIHKTFTLIDISYFNKIQPHCHIEHGLHGYGSHAILENLNIFEQLGLVSTTGLAAFFVWLVRQDNDDLAAVAEIVETLKALITNHQATRAPSYDSHIIEISSAIYLLSCLSEKEFIEQWIGEMLHHIAFAYAALGKHFPIESDSFDDLVALNIAGNIDRERLMRMSTLLPILAQWCCTLKLDKPYLQIVDITKNVFKDTTLQIWYPDTNTDQFLYIGNAAVESGNTEAPITIPETTEEMQKMIAKVQARTITSDDISANRHQCLILPFIASRHYRTPFLPFYWQCSFSKNQ